MFPTGPSTHRSLRQLFHQTERAIADNAFEQGAAYLGELIDAARGHFRNTEDVAYHAGLTKETVGWPSHNEFLDRARILQAHCHNGQQGSSVSVIRNELVVLLSYMVEYDTRFANDFNAFQACEGESETEA